MTFAKFVLNRFFSVAAQNNKAYVELLFWKNVGAVHEMTEGYSKDGLVLVFACLLLCVIFTHKNDRLYINYSAYATLQIHEEKLCFSFIPP